VSLADVGTLLDSQFGICAFAPLKFIREKFLRGQKQKDFAGIKHRGFFENAPRVEHTNGELRKGPSEVVLPGGVEQTPEIRAE